MVDSAFHASEVNQLSTRIFWGIAVKSKPSPISDFAVLKHLNSMHKKGRKVFFT